MTTAPCLRSLLDNQLISLLAGFDPLELGAVPANLQRFREAELIHSRWAMLGAAGVIAVEALGFGDWVSAQTASPQTYFGVVIPGGDNITANVTLFTVFLAFAESARQSNTDAQKRLYPGGQFDPMGMSKDPKAFKEAQLKEIKNGRLAMLACLGFAGQAASTGTTPLANLAAHLADPFHVNVGSNPIALPFL